MFFKPILAGRLAHFSGVPKSVVIRYLRDELIFPVDKTKAGYPRFSMDTILVVKKIRKMEKDGWATRMIKKKMTKQHG